MNNRSVLAVVGGVMQVASRYFTHLPAGGVMQVASRYFTPFRWWLE